MSDVLARVKGPIEILCDEIGFLYRSRMETVETVVSFATALIDEIADMREIEEMLFGVTNRRPSSASMDAISIARGMVAKSEIPDLIAAASQVHDFCNEKNPEGSLLSDTIVDMVSSCASIVRFGLETPCRSRHAASAADHVWRAKYGIKCEDQHTNGWRKDWTRSKLQDALLLQIRKPITS